MTAEVRLQDWSGRSIYARSRDLTACVKFEATGVPGEFDRFRLLVVGLAVPEASVKVSADDHDGNLRGPGCAQRERRRLGVTASRPGVVDKQDARIVSQHPRGTVPVGGERMRRRSTTLSESQERLIPVFGLTDDRANDAL